MNRVLEVCLLFLLLFAKTEVKAQDLDPRAYVRIPINGTILISGFSYSQGGVLTDPTLPLENLKANVEVASVGAGRTFGLFGRTAQAIAVLPYAWAQANATVKGEYESLTRAGLSDIRVRLSVLLFGGKALKRSEFSKEKSNTVVGTSIMVTAPSGQYFSNKLINLGTSRWSFKPEVAFSQKIASRWMIDFYTGVWLFTTNSSFYPGNSVRKQDPLVAFQTHVSYNLNTLTWIAFDATFYTGGQSSVNGAHLHDQQENSRFGATIALPVGKRNSLKIAYSKGAIIRVGADFSTVTLGLTSAWFDKPKPPIKN